MLARIKIRWDNVMYHPMKNQDVLSPNKGLIEGIVVEQSDQDGHD